MNTRRNFLKKSTSAGLGLLGGTLAAPLPSRAQTAKPDPLIDYDALGLAALIRKKEITAAELAEVVIRRIESVNPLINCIATPTYARARQKAATIPTDSTFAGVPSLIKDMIDVGGVRRTDGSRLLATNVPKKSVRWIEAFEASGLNMIGTTTVPEFASGFESELFGKTRNPWNLDYTCMLSSSGAAAAVACGIVPLVHGTDGGGSNRYPSSACGTFGFKPSRGRMYSGESNGGHDMFKTNCAISRTVRDSAALFDQTEDKKAKGFEPMGMVAGPSKKRLRIAFARDGVQNLPPTVASVREALEETAKLLSSLGHQVELIEHPVDGQEFFDNFRYAYLPKFTPLIGTVEAISGREPIKSGLLSRWTATMIESGRDYTPEQIARGTAYFENLGKLYQKVFENFDVLLTPALPTETSKLDLIKTTDSFTEKGHILEHLMSIGSPINPMGDCAMSVPLSFSRKTGMPIGSMFHARSGKDQMLYELAYELEEARPWKNKWAPYSVKHIPVR